MKGRYTIGMKIRKKFGRRFFDGEIVRIDDSNRCHVKYTDGDSEDLSEDELKTHIACYNIKYDR